MFDRLAGIESRYEELDHLLADPDTLSDYSKVAELAQERAAIEQNGEAYRQYLRASDELEDAQELVSAESDPELRAMAEEEAQSLSARMAELEGQLKTLLLPKDPRDDRNVIVE